MIGNDDSAESSGLLVSCNFFTVDGLDHPIVGRLLTADDCRNPGQTPSVIVAESVWRNRFGSDPTLIGRTIEVNNHAVMVAGVVPDGTSELDEARDDVAALHGNHIFSAEHRVLQPGRRVLAFARCAPGAWILADGGGGRPEHPGASTGRVASGKKNNDYYDQRLVD
jgi:hypothetical protein